MKRALSFLVVSTLAFTIAPVLKADVKTQQKVTFQLGGLLGSIANRFAGDAAKDGLITTTAVKGSRQMRGSAQTGRIIDLAEEKVYDLDMKKKEYRVTTFAELRKQWQDAKAKAEQNSKSTSDPASNPDKSGKQFEVTASVKATGQSKTIAGHSTKETVLTVTVHEKGKTLEAGGGLELVSTMWLAPRIAALDEIREFDAKFFKAVYGDMLAGADPGQMAMLSAAYPSFKEMSEKMASELKKLEGTSLQTTTGMTVVPSAEAAAAAPAQSPSSGGGIMGRLGAKIGPKPKAEGTRSEAFRSTDETLSIETAVTAEDTAIPAGFKEKK